MMIFLMFKFVVPTHFSCKIQKLLKIKKLMKIERKLVKIFRKISF